MTPRQRLQKTAKTVARDATNEEVKVLDLETLKRDALAAASPEGRISGAKPFPLKQPPLDGEVLVAPAVGEEFLHSIMSMSGAALLGSAGGDETAGVDRAFIKGLVKACVVQPILDDEAIELLIGANAALFQALAAFCMQVSMLDTHVTIGERLLAIDTDAHALFFDSAVGSLSSRMPV